MKKIISLILALAMIMALAVTATAVDIQITAPDADGNLANLTYTAYKVFTASESVAGGGFSYMIQMDGPFWDVVYDNKTTVFSGSGASVPGETGWNYVTVAEGYDADDVINVLKNSTNKGTGLTATYSDGMFVISGVDSGYYYIESSFGTGILVDTVGNSTITIAPKNELPTITKTISKVNGTAVADGTTSVSANIGDTITFELEITIPSTATPGATIDVFDVMGSGLSAGGTLYGTYGGLGFYGNQHWRGVASDSLNMGADLLGQFTIGESNIGKTVTLEVSATLDTDAVIDGDGNKNEAWLTYSSNGKTYTTEKDEAFVKTYQIDVYKYANGQRANPLPGAGFKLMNAEGKYYTYRNGYVTWTDEGTEYTTTTDNGCKVEFKGLANGTYTLVESTVPAGFNPADDQELKIENSSLTGSSQVDVNNNSGSELPSTGGIGTTLFYVFGSMMMLSAAVLLITKRRVA